MFFFSVTEFQRMSGWRRPASFTCSKDLLSKKTTAGASATVRGRNWIETANEDSKL